MTMMLDNGSTAAYSNTPHCLVCAEPLDFRKTGGRRSRKPSLMFICPVDGRHFRAFVTYLPYVEAVLAGLAAHTDLSTNEGDTDEGESGHELSGSNVGK